MEKEKLYMELCNEVQQCNICENVMFSPHLLKSNCFVHAEDEKDKKYINLWNDYQGSLDAEIMVIGQDYGIINGKFVTDEFLVDLFNIIGINIKKCDDRLFFTNIANCYRKTKSTGTFNKGCLVICANKYIGRLIRIILPKIIIVLGQDAFNALAFCEKAKLVCEDSVEENEKDVFSNIIKHKYALVFDEGYKIAVFPVFHPGALGRKNRNEKLQREDWEKISKFYKEKVVVHE